MRHGLTAAIASVVVLLAGFAPASARMIGILSLDDDDYGQHDEINETYTLSPGADVTINDISGPVDIETGSGEQAEVHVVRSARRAEDLQHKKILVEHTPTSLTIRTEPHQGVHWDHVQVRQRVTLRLPTRVALRVNDIAGHVRVGEIDGPVRINDVAGALDIARVNGAPHINDIAGSVTLAVGEVGAEGVQINDIAGRVELAVEAGTNADLDIGDISGRIDVDVPNVTVVGKIDPEHFQGKIGGGGPRITISDIAGSVRIHN
jgi:DUF4097 and DUF4098 domain-containing protein YvlB